MIKSFLISMFAVFLFALGAAGAWFYLSMKLDEQKQEELASQTQPAPPPANVDPVPQVIGGGELPAVVRGPELDPDELYRINMATAAKRQQLREFDDRLRDQKQRIKAADADTKAAQREVEGTLSQVRGLMDATEKLLGDVTVAMEELQKEKAALKRQQEELKTLEGEAGAGFNKNLSAFAEIVQGLPPERAGETIKELWNDGKMDFAIQLLRKMEARSVAKILAEVEDAQLIAELASRYPEAALR